MTEWCLNVYLYVCTDNIQNIDIGTLGTCMGPYFVYVQVLWWVWFLDSRGTSLVIQWHRLPLRVPDDTLVVHSPDVEWWYCDMGQFGDTCWCTAYHVSTDALCCIICLQCLHQSISIRLNVLSKAMAWHNGPFSKRSFNTFSFPCPSNLFVEYTCI